MSRYQNMDGPPKLPTYRDMRNWWKERRGKIKDMSFRVPSAQDDPARLQVAPKTARLVWIGHSTFLLQLGGLTILTDPVWASRMGFERRLTPPGVAIGDLPDIDVVLLSHGHYDHLHFASLKRLKGNPLHLVPEGTAGLFRRKGLYRVQELAWWDSHTIAGVTFTFVPAQHWTRRTLWDMNRSHWGGWVIEPDGADAADAPPAERAPTVYFAGDSGYFAGFSEIGRRFPGIGTALLPIGAYEPEWFMSPQHVSPEEAVQAFLDVGAHTFVPMHYGAFRLADDTPKEALDRLFAAWDKAGLEKDRLLVPKLGELVEWNGLQPSACSRC